MSSTGACVWHMLRELIHCRRNDLFTDTLNPRRRRCRNYTVAGRTGRRRQQSQRWRGGQSRDPRTSHVDTLSYTYTQ